MWFPGRQSSSIFAGYFTNIYLKTVFGSTESRLLGGCAALWLSSAEEFPTFSSPLAGGKNRADANGSVTNVLAGSFSCMLTPPRRGRGRWVIIMCDVRGRASSRDDVGADVGSAARPLWPLTCCHAQAECLNYPTLVDKKIYFFHPCRKCQSRRDGSPRALHHDNRVLDRLLSLFLIVFGFERRPLMPRSLGPTGHADT